MTTKPIIEVKDLKKSFGTLQVLKGINTEVQKGEVVVVIGPSGSGKSTFLRCLNLLETPTAGSIYVDGAEITDPKCDINLHRQKMGMVFQHFNLFNNMTILRNLTLAPMTLLKKSKEDAEAQALALLRRVGLEDKANAYPSQLSGGQQQRIAIARAILKNAPILILDEATSASDPENQMEIDRAIQNLCKGKTVIVVAHRLSALKMCERVAVVEDHTITCAGTHEEVRRDNAYYRKAWEDYEKARNITYQLEGGRGE